MLLYRKASKHDAENIAQLHAANWQLNYRGILDDYYLDHEVIEDRKNVWQERLLHPSSDMYIVLAEEGTQLIGFGCIFFNESEQFGSYLDNLHVYKDFSGKGIGKKLMSLLAAEILKELKRPDMYLWVLSDNDGAKRLYEKLRGQKKEQVMETGLGNTPVEKIRYYWPNVADLIVD